MLENDDRVFALGEALELALATWLEGVTPKIHFSSPRLEAKAKDVALLRLREQLWRAGYPSRCGNR